MILVFRNRDIQSERMLGVALISLLFSLLGRGEKGASEFGDEMDEDNMRGSS